MRKREKRSRILWVEKILQHPDRISDGRKRLLLHIIIPYFISVKRLGEAEAEEKCRQWLEATGADYSKYRAFIRCEIRAVARRKLLPMRKEKFFSLYPDLRWLDGTLQALQHRF
jgi:hypothetical protein